MPPRRRLGLRQLPAAAREFDFGDDGADVAVVDTSKSIGKGSGGIRNEVASRRQDTGPSEAKKARQDISAKEVIVVEDKEKTKDDATMVLGLYQQGMLPDHTLQLQFMRRKVRVGCVVVRRDSLDHAMVLTVFGVTVKFSQ